MIKDYDLLGLIPFLSREDIAKDLTSEELVIFNSIVDGVQGGEIAHQPQIPVGQLLLIMERLNVAPVWGKEGTKVYRMNLGDRLPIFIIAPDPATDSVPVEVLERQFLPFDKLDDLVLAILAEAKAIKETGVEPQILPEDHPEFDSVGFVCFQTNKVWTIASPQIEAAKTEPTQFALLHTLIQSNEGRVELAKRMSANQLMSATDYMSDYLGLGLQSRTPDVAKLLRRKEQEVTIDLMTGKLAESYKRRYLPQASAPIPDIVVPPAADQGDEPAGQGE